VAKRDVCEIASRFNAFAPSLDWLETIALYAEHYLHINPKREGAKLLKEARNMARLAQKAIHQDNTYAAAFFALGALQAAWQAEVRTELGRVMIDSGVTSYRGGERINVDREKTADAEHERWKDAAKAIRAKSRRRLSKTEIAKKIDATRWNTIRKFI
jgi:hypothetical protein